MDHHYFKFTPTGSSLCCSGIGVNNIKCDLPVPRRGELYSLVNFILIISKTTLLYVHSLMLSQPDNNIVLLLVLNVVCIYTMYFFMVLFTIRLPNGLAHTLCSLYACLMVLHTRSVGSVHYTPA